MNFEQLDIKRKWLRLALDLLNAIENNRIKQTLFPDELEFVEIGKGYEQQYNSIMDEILTDHIDISSLLKPSQS